MKVIKIFSSAVILFVSFILLPLAACIAQTGPVETTKVTHAEPLFNDLVRDLGARKGEKELNIGFGSGELHQYKEYGFLVEYEFAPVNRLGVEVETDLAFYNGTKYEMPGNKIADTRLSAQYSFLVSPKYNTTLAIGYSQIFHFVDFKDYGKTRLVKGASFNPFFIAAKRWGNNFHTLIYTGPVFERHRSQRAIDVNWQINTSVHYMIPATENFVGVELNEEIDRSGFVMTIRPQVKIMINEHLAVGFVAAFPVNRNNEGAGSFFRVIYEI